MMMKSRARIVLLTRTLLSIGRGAKMIAKGDAAFFNVAYLRLRLLTHVNVQVLNDNKHKAAHLLARLLTSFA